MLIGGAGDDRIDGGTDRDLIFGDNVQLDRTLPAADLQNPRFRLLSGTQLYSTAVASNGEPLVGTASQLDPTGTPVWEDFDITILDHSFAVQANPQNRFGNDYIAGGAASDQIFGQLGNDMIQGDGSIDVLSALYASIRSPDARCSRRGRRASRCSSRHRRGRMAQHHRWPALHARVLGGHDRRRRLHRRQRRQRRASSATSARTTSSAAAPSSSA